MSDLKPAFTRQHFDDLKAAQRTLHDLEREYDKAQACGIECAGYRALSANLSERLEAMERHYFMPPPPQ
jgi:hypothetical protein